MNRKFKNTQYFIILIILCLNVTTLSSCNDKKIASGYSLSEESIVIDKNSSKTLEIEYDDSINYNFDVKWESENTDIADVVKGTVYGINKGITSIWANITVHKKNSDVELKLHCTVTVDENEVLAEEIQLPFEKKDIPQYTIYNIMADIIPNNSTQTTIIWSSSDTNIITVDDTGCVTALNMGKATLTATIEDTDISDSCIINVIKNTDTSIIDDISLNYTSIKIKTGYTEQLTATIIPSSYKGDIIFSTNNSSIATVSSTGLIKGISPGVASISITAGNLTKYCTVSVIKLDQEFTPASQVELNYNSFKATNGQTVKLTATTYPLTSTEIGIWSSSDTSLATVDSEGNVYIDGEATKDVTITYFINDNVNASCIIHIANQENIASQIKLSYTALRISVGNSAKLTVTLYPETADDPIIFTSSDPSIIDIDNEGKVTAVRSGNATITATSSQNSKLSATCTIISEENTETHD